MRIISTKTLRDYGAQHSAAEQSLLAWVDEVRKARWTQPAEIKAQFGNASILRSRRVVFNVKGNDYRIVVAVAYKLGVVYIKFVGSHAEYDRIDANTVEDSA
jgi:mRNA interferase HigB